MSEDLDRRDWLVGTAVKSGKAMGLDVSAEAVERSAARDLEIVDRMKKSGSLAQRTISKAEKQERRNEETVRGQEKVAQLAAEKDATLSVSELPAVDSPIILPRLSGVEAEKLIAMHQRIMKICAPVEGYVMKYAEPLGNQCQHPDLARRVLMHTACFARGIGSYSGLRYEDRQRKYVRAVEDICDASNGKLGPWWVK